MTKRKDVLLGNILEFWAYLCSANVLHSRTTGQTLEQERQFGNTGKERTQSWRRDLLHGRKKRRGGNTR